ncbi:DUF4244 domain-containing protein [Nonomuraea thailandensis]|nr:DUF4244 domain-containing protein [Nonomuraea thailandensis]
MHSPATTPDDIAAATAHAGASTPPAHPGHRIIRSPAPLAPFTLTSHKHPDPEVKITNAATSPRRSIAPDRRTDETSASALAIREGDSRAPSTSSSGQSPAPSSAGKHHRIRSSRPRTNRWLHYAATNRERGMSTAEYAVGTIAACAFAALLFKVVSSPEVQEMLTSLIDRALKTGQE